jgi:hypothetical protein
MDEWMDGWINGWVDGWVDRWVDAVPTGADTKIMKNCGKIHLRRTKLDLLMNKLVVLVSFQPDSLHRGH